LELFEIEEEEEGTSKSLPVVTIGTLDPLRERDYREQCRARLTNISEQVYLEQSTTAPSVYHPTVKYFSA
jgi:hypothetical protein